ncbi:hypothetical protein GRI89_10950 [Altererythrobacter salegens]|uniref:Uncharacterized protein n=1 Tax=Croceibacterium salegens TaxID=1737568 RepID=A0A6I4SZ28_9SPHN|nr:hypothetical protein [Croceibacterium salegens]MXO60056.1 hypothetical protein [Croceibacterium salegens]
MTSLALIVILLITSFGLLIAFVRLEVAKAEKSGVLPRWGRWPPFYKPITRSAEPELFDDGLRWLRVVPWIAAVATSFVILLVGLIL